jgi:hypothetical protein
MPKWQKLPVWHNAKNGRTMKNTGKTAFFIFFWVWHGGCISYYHRKTIGNLERRVTIMRKYYGSDDGYDYAKDNRDGDVDAYVAWVKEWRKAQDEKKVEVPQK